MLIVGSGGLSHDPPVPTLATATGGVRRIVHGQPDTRATTGPAGAVIEAAREFAAGRGPLQPLNPDWDHAFLELLDSNRLAEVDGWSNTLDRAPRRAIRRTKSARGWPPSRRWPRTVAYETQQRFYRAAPELIAGFAIRTAVLTS